MCKIETLLNRVMPFVALSVALFFSFFLYFVVFKSEPFLTTSSPGGTFRVDLTGRKDRPLLPIIYHTVRFSVRKVKEPFVTGEYLHSGDFLDPSFTNYYPQQRWVAENVLQFYREENFRDGIPDVLFIANNSSKRIRYLRVEMVDVFLLFDLEPGTKTTLSASPPRGGLKWTDVRGEFSDGHAIEEKGVDFKIKKEVSRPYTFFINVSDSETAIDSPYLEKYSNI